MPIISAFCKKGGVGKTTFLGYLAHYYATQGKTVLVISADDQNSVFKIFLPIMMMISLNIYLLVKNSHKISLLKQE